jgi:signal transduction histidine kinase
MEINDTKKRARILIVDDEPALRLGLAAIIKRRGYEVLTASDGNEGIQKATNELPDLILSDVMMPPPNGFEMRQILSQDARLGSIPFIFLTARSGVEDRVNGIRGGADDYVVKPYLPDELLARIEAVLRRVEVEQARGREQMMETARQDMDKLKQEILQNFQHELRTPLVTTVMSLELAVSKRFDDPEEQVGFIRTALSSLERMESLVTDFIFLTNIDHGDLNKIRQRIDVENHILFPISKMQERFSSKNMQFITELDVPHPITAPRRELTHAVLHLVNNAFKFSPENGKVGLFVRSSGNGGAVISVCDQGPGIPVELREKVFERYYQISQGHTRSHEGLGVGLTLARAVFENIGGTVSILEKSSGCCVQAVIPEQRPEDIVYG